MLRKIKKHQQCHWNGVIMSKHLMVYVITRLSTQGHKELNIYVRRGSIVSVLK